MLEWTAQAGGSHRAWRCLRTGWTWYPVPWAADRALGAGAGLGDLGDFVQASWSCDSAVGWPWQVYLLWVPVLSPGRLQGESTPQRAAAVEIACSPLQPPVGGRVGSLKPGRSFHWSCRIFWAWIWQMMSLWGGGDTRMLPFLWYPSTWLGEPHHAPLSPKVKEK